MYQKKPENQILLKIKVAPSIFILYLHLTPHPSIVPESTANIPHRAERIEHSVILNRKS